MEPRILKSALTGRWYVVTRYKVTSQAPDGSDLITAQDKHDVTDYIERIIKGETEELQGTVDRVREWAQQLRENAAHENEFMVAAGAEVLALLDEGAEAS